MITRVPSVDGRNYFGLSNLLKYLLVVGLFAMGLRPMPAAATPFVYVANFDGHNVAVIDAGLATGPALVATVPVPAGPCAPGHCGPAYVAITPDGAYAYVTLCCTLPGDTGVDSVAVISTALALTDPTNAVVATIAVPHPEGVAITPDGAHAFVATGFTVSVIDTALALTNPANAVVATVPLGGGAGQVAITPGGAYALVTGGGGVAVIDTALALSQPAAAVSALPTASGGTNSASAAAVSAPPTASGGENSASAAAVSAPPTASGGENSASVAANFYSTVFPTVENPLSEGGRWINGKTTGLDWQDVMVISTGFATFAAPSLQTFNDATAVLTGTWGPDQYVRVVAALPTPDTSGHAQEIEIRLRTTITAHSITGYEVLGGGQIVRWNGPLGDFTILPSQGYDPGLRDGDTLEARMVGNVITVFINGVLVNQAIDDTFTSGNPGIGFDTANPVAPAFGIKSFMASDRPLP